MASMGDQFHDKFRVKPVDTTIQFVDDVDAKITGLMDQIAEEAQFDKNERNAWIAKRNRDSAEYLASVSEHRRTEAGGQQGAAKKKQKTAKSGKDAAAAAKRRKAAPGAPGIERQYLVDNSELQHRGEGVRYRLSKDLKDQDPLPAAAWGSVVVGVDEGDGWLRVGTRFLPMRVKDTRVITLQASGPKAASRPDAKARVATLGYNSDEEDEESSEGAESDAGAAVTASTGQAGQAVDESDGEDSDSSDDDDDEDEGSAASSGEEGMALDGGHLF